MSYKRPPITEAVLELRFAGAARRDAVERAARRLKEFYPNQEAESVQNVNIKPSAAPTIDIVWNGMRLTSNDRVETTLLRVTSFVRSRLAPYPGWESFRDSSVRDWSAWRRSAGLLPISRIGLRYVNRLDIPSEPGTDLHASDYLQVGPSLPKEVPVINTYALQAAGPLNVLNLMVVINSASVPSPLLGHASFTLDIDVTRDVDLPIKDEDIWRLIEEMRVQKNRLFESCITDQARELFNR